MWPFAKPRHRESRRARLEADEALVREFLEALRVEVEPRGPGGTRAAAAPIVSGRPTRLPKVGPKASEEAVDET
jgi:hypothetical protein